MSSRPIIAFIRRHKNFEFAIFAASIIASMALASLASPSSAFLKVPSPVPSDSSNSKGSSQQPTSPWLSAESGMPPTSPLVTASKVPILGVDGSAYQTQAFLDNLSTTYGIHWSREYVTLGQHWASAVYYPLLSADINILGMLGASLFQNNSWTLSNWETAISLATNMYPRIHVWEIWNEPQLPSNQGGYENGTAYNYFMMMKTAYQIIKAHNSSDIVLGLGGIEVFSYKTANTQNYDWAQQIWNYGGGNYCDAISLHAYTSDTYLITDVPRSPGPTVGQMISSQLNEYEALTGKPIWISETGIPSNNGTGVSFPLNNSLTKQATFLDQMYTLLLSKPYINAIMWYNAIGLSRLHNYDMGLFANSTTSDYPKPALSQFEDFQRNLTTATVSIILIPSGGAAPPSLSNSFVVSYISAGKPTTATYNGGILSIHADPSTNVVISSKSSAFTWGQHWCFDWICSSVSFKAASSAKILSSVYYNILPRR
jgi:hypothetical protein